MVFSSILFIFFFLPIFLILYFLFPKKYRNYVLMVFSLIFYAWGEPKYIFLMIFSSLINYIFAILISKNRKKFYLIICIVINLVILGIFKYANFVLDNIGFLFKGNIGTINIVLPIGISFFTFQAMSYTIDVYRKEVSVQYNYFKLLTYICMFPQLIAGPIVRYETIMKELDNRDVSFSSFSNGFLRFLNGLFKKVLIANTIGLLWNKILGLDVLDVSFGTVWLGALAFTFQIYFDFSGYSDMAIGLGKMLGFNYLENFDYPYIAKSITDFWRRWHISLSSWFRDYVYIPLGGNRCNKFRHIINILIVWLLTGLWHGASWNFIIWGLYYGILLIIEKYLISKVINKMPNFVKHIYTMALVLIGWVIFAITDLDKLVLYLRVMFGLGGKIFDNTFVYLLKNYFVLFVIAILFSIPFAKKINIKSNNILKFGIAIVYIILFITTIALIVSDTYNPFLYFRF